MELYVKLKHITHIRFICVASFAIFPSHCFHIYIPVHKCHASYDPNTTTGLQRSQGRYE